MNAIVAGFTPVFSGWTSPEKAVAGLPDGSSQSKTDSDRPEADPPKLSDGDHGTPPFWTWFIENPRRPH
jgi:hypothetical protein